MHGCAACRAQHNTNALKLKAAFMAHAAALAPLPLLTGRLPFIARLGLRARNLAARLVPHTIQTPGGGVLRERAVTLLATGGAAGKLAAGAAAVAVIAGGTIGATKRTATPHLASRHGTQNSACCEGGQQKQQQREQQRGRCRDRRRSARRRELTSTGPRRAQGRQRQPRERTEANPAGSPTSAYPIETSQAQAADPAAAGERRQHKPAPARRRNSPPAGTGG